MTNPKIEKIDEAIAKTKKRILEQQAKLRELERERIDLENAEIVATFRNEQLTVDDIAALIKLKTGGSTFKQEPADKYKITESE